MLHRKYDIELTLGEGETSATSGKILLQKGKTALVCHTEEAELTVKAYAADETEAGTYTIELGDNETDVVIDIEEYDRGGRIGWGTATIAGGGFIDTNAAYLTITTDVDADIEVFGE